MGTKLARPAKGCWPSCQALPRSFQIAELREQSGVCQHSKRHCRDKWSRFWQDKPQHWGPPPGAVQGTHLDHTVNCPPQGGSKPPQTAQSPPQAAVGPSPPSAEAAAELLPAAHPAARVAGTEAQGLDTEAQPATTTSRESPRQQAGAAVSPAPGRAVAPGKRALPPVPRFNLYSPTKGGLQAKPAPKKLQQPQQKSLQEVVCQRQQQLAAGVGVGKGSPGENSADILPCMHVTACMWYMGVCCLSSLRSEQCL